MDILSLSHAQRDLIQREIARSVTRPAIRETEQAPPDSPTTVQRTSTDVTLWSASYYATSGVTPDADTPAWTDAQTGDVTAAVADSKLTITIAE